jgi:uncharacterized protein (DUF1697 family)
MTVFISMLRGVNVGGHNIVKMEALRKLYESLGFKNVQTLIQSGNVVFQAGQTNSSLLAKRIGDGIEASFGFRVSVLVRTVSEMRGVVARNPFRSRKGIDPRKLLVSFFPIAPTREICKQVLAINTAPEELLIGNCELYIYFPNGMGRPKLSIPLIERTLKTAGTGRNWNTVLKLLAMAENIEASL